MVIVRPGPERRWGDETRIDSDEEARERLINAAEMCFARYGLSKTTVEDVAREAKVSRSTIYRYFDGREALIAAAFIRESVQLFDEAVVLMRRQPSISTLMVELILFVVDAVRNGKYLPLLFKAEDTPLTAKAVTASMAFFERAREVIGPFFDEAKARGELRPEMNLDDFIEWHLRVIFSLLTSDTPHRDRESLRGLLETYVVPPLTVQPALPKARASRPARRAKPAR